MNDKSLRRRIAVQAARLLRERRESSLGSARLRAARQLCHGYVKPDQFPSETEIRDEIERISYIEEGDARFDNLFSLRKAALNLLRGLEEFRPQITGDVLAGDVRYGGRIEIVVDDVPSARERLNQLLEQETDASFTVELIPRGSEHSTVASVEEFEVFLSHQHPDLNLEETTGQEDDELDRFQVYRMLLVPLRQVQQSRSSHPEGDALYHSLQVFQLTLDERPYDEEFLLAALLHDVGKGIDPQDHVRASLDAVRGYVTERTVWFIEHHHEAQRFFDNTLGARARRRLQQHPDFEDLLLLARCDRAGRVPGAIVPELDEALETIRDLTRTYG